MVYVNYDRLFYLFSKPLSQNWFDSSRKYIVISHLSGFQAACVFF